MSVFGVNHFNVIDNYDALVAFRDSTGSTFPLGNDLGDSYLPLRRAASGSSPNGVHVVVDRQGIIRYLTRNYDEAALEVALDEALAAP